MTTQQTTLDVGPSERVGVIGTAQVDSFLSESARTVFGLRWIVSTCRWNTAAEREIVGRQA